MGDEPLPVRLLDEPHVVYRAESKAVVANDICPHRGVPLSKGYGVGDDTGIRCAYGTRQAPRGFQWLRHFDVHLPFTATLVVHFPDGGLLNIMNAASPVSARRTRMFAPIARNFDTDQPVQAVYDFNHTVFEETRAIVEVRKPGNLPPRPQTRSPHPRRPQLPRLPPRTARSGPEPLLHGASKDRHR
ncbi:Rieske 2Fe-2S domain-containing protein [Streptomyces sp. NPDC020800]|uniref:Rieske 2Fe-2S domain-containing protein n=1 Tax=Streptomyces sp. NPDC020800 TaxID=3365092 RepID=UPI0037893DD5